MRNAEEHKKLLAQIAELEKNSVNYFDVEKEFFLIDSDNLAEVKTRLYGYSIQATGIYEQDNLTEDAVKNLDGRGCYVYVEVKDGNITIKQDLNGCWGIYLFRHGDYFALSNSFFRLLDHVKFKYPLTVNRDYCHQIVLKDLCSHTYSETAVNEVRLVERNAILHVDVAKKQLEIELINYRENTVPLDSEEGIAILDGWDEFWSGVWRGIAQNTKFLKADLTGGFDSRIAFVPALHSGIDLNKMQIFSNTGTFHTYKEDFAIASQITAHYSLKLNQPLPASRSLRLSFSDMWNNHFYGMQPFHKSSVLFVGQKAIDKSYNLTGYGGETIRNYWVMPPKRYLEGQKWRTRNYSGSLAQELFHSLETLTKSAFLAVREKYKIDDENCEDIPQYLYEETRCRHHFGKFSLNHYFRNNILISPALDPALRTLKLNTPECSDTNLMMTLLFTRLEPDLLKFPFDSKHSIKPETIEYARNLNTHFPICHKKADNLNGGGQPFHLQPHDLQVEKILSEGKNNPNIPGNLLLTCLKAIFESSRTYGLFRVYFNEELYRNNFFDYPRDHMIGVVGITKVLEDVEISQRNHSPYRDMQHFLEQDYCQIPDGKDDEIIRKFRRYFTALIFVRRTDKKIEPENLQILSVSDSKAKISNPDWWQQFGICHIIDSYTGDLEIVAKANSDGKIQVGLSAPYVLNPAGNPKLIPYWIDYTRFAVNGKVIFDKLTPAWHNKPYNYNMDVKASDEIKVQVEWLPHRSDV